MTHIYMLFNSVSKKAYIGMTDQTIERRWQQHCYQAEHGSKNPIHRAIRKHGKDAFEVHFIGTCISREQAGRFERALITATKLKTKAYNATTGGEGTSGLSRESIDRRTAKLRGRKRSLEERNKQSETRMKGKISTRTIQELYESGLSAKDIGERMNMNPATVLYRLRTRGIPRRKYCSSITKDKFRAWWNSPEGLKEKEKACLRIQKRWSIKRSAGMN